MVDLLKQGAQTGLNLYDLQDNKIFILQQMGEMIDDEENLVKLDALSVFA